MYSQRHIQRANPTAQSLWETLWCSWAGTLFPADIRAAQQGQSAIKTGFQKDLLLKCPWDPTMAEGTMHCVLSTPPGGFRPMPWVILTASNGWLLGKGLGMGWKVKVFNSDKLKVSAGHGHLACNSRKCPTAPKASAGCDWGRALRQTTFKREKREVPL